MVTANRQDVPIHPRGRPMKAILLAGGAGSRLYPLTRVASKQLQAVYDKPMIYYPLATLIGGGVREFCLISTPDDLPRYQQLLGDGSQWGIRIEYREQAKPEGIAQALTIAEDFVGGEPVALMLGDNIFFGSDAIPRAMREFKSGATVFAYHVHDPERYGVVAFDAQGKATAIVEKPKQFMSPYAIPGIYLYDAKAAGIARNLKPSARGELEITDVNRAYLDAGTLQVVRLDRGFAWLDAGTSTALQEASSYVATIERRQGLKVGCPEEAAWKSGFLSDAAFKALVASLPVCEYRQYLERVIAEEAA